MDREYNKNRKIDRSSWGAGPWDKEPDFVEWITQVGYPAWAARLDSGAWFLIIEAPLPPTDTSLALTFYHTLHRKRRNELDHQCGVVGHTSGQEGIGDFTLSMELWVSPCHTDRAWHRGPYKTLEELKQICEDVASDIYETHKEGTYVNYFKGK